MGLHWRQGRLLAFEVHDDAGKVKGVRPLGGSVEFGEPAREAVIREFKEELGIDITIVGEPVVLENLYVHEGSTGHEILFVFQVEFPAAAFSGQSCILFHEDNGDACVARWHDLAELDVEDGPELYPRGLKKLLASVRRLDQSGSPPSMRSGAPSLPPATPP